MSRYLNHVVEVVQTLIDRQSELLGRAPFGPRCLTVTASINRPYRSLAGWRDGKLYAIPIAGREPEARATRLDCASWETLAALAALTGDDQYATLRRGMVEVFRNYGFDPRSGLAYFGAMAEFNVLCLGPAPYFATDAPMFKFCAHLPYDALWDAAPAKLARCLRSSYFGLVTRPQSMDLNRCCPYGFDDAPRRHVLPFNPHHIAFAGAAALMIHAWAYLHAKTGEPEPRRWIEAMADKWAPLQDSGTGLMPHLLGAKIEGESQQTAQPYCAIGDAGTALSLLDAADLLRRRDPNDALGSSLHDMGRRLMAGIARFGYDARRRIFTNWLNVADGSEYTNAYVYCFHSQAQKDEHVKQSPELANVAVHPGCGFYTGGPWSFGAGEGVEPAIAQAAERTGDAFLRQRAAELADLFVDASAELPGPLNDQDQWTFSAAAGHIRALVILARLDRQPRRLEQARQIADRQLDMLRGAGDAAATDSQGVAWWRMPFRHDWLAALLDLHEATESGL